MPLSPFRFASLACIPHAVTTRHGGISEAPYATLNLGYATADAEENITANRETVRDGFGIGAASLQVARLTHGTDVAVFRAGTPEEWPGEEVPVRRGSAMTHTMFSADGVVSNVPGLHFLLTFADCVPLLFFDPERDVLGVAHAGWRGTAAGMAREVVMTMRREFGSRPEAVAAAVGPSIGPCCYQVGPEVAGTFRENGQRPVMRGDRLDLWDSTVQQLTEMGVRAVEVAGVCTSCNTGDFFSHRAEGGVTGRFSLVAGLGA